MSDRAAEFLAEQKRLTEAATEGPWESDKAVFEYDHKPTPYVAPEFGNRNICQVYSDAGDADAAFIAAARSSVPKLIAAVEAVMEAHRRSHAVFSWATGGVRFEDPCPDCDGKAGVHPCGCWADVDIEYVCAECDKSKERAAWPCPTIRAIEAALGGEGDGE